MLLECQFKAVFSSPINHCPYTPIHTGSFNSSKVYFNTSKTVKYYTVVGENGSTIINLITDANPNVVSFGKTSQFNEKVKCTCETSSTIH